MEPQNTGTNKMIIVVVVIAVAVIGIYALINSSKGNVAMEKQKDATTKEGGVMMKKEEGVMMTKAGSYEAYSPEKIAQAAAKGDVVLFFRALWCPTCRALDADINANLKNIPANLTILYVDYDNSTDLKKKYGVTYQHTLVQVDKNGTLIKKWTKSPTLTAFIADMKK